MIVSLFMLVDMYIAFVLLVHIRFSELSYLLSVNKIFGCIPGVKRTVWIGSVAQALFLNAGQDRLSDNIPLPIIKEL